MKITSIKQQQKRSDRYSIFVDEAYSFSLSESALLSSGLVSGQELTRQQVDEYKQLSADDKRYNQTLRYVAMRSRSVGEVRAYLRRKEAPPPLVDNIIDRLSALGLLNDQQFAESFVHDRQLLRPTSKRRLILELKKRYITESIIDDVLQDESVNEADSLKAVIAKKRQQTKYQDDTKLMQYLARQGFSYGSIKAALQVDD